MNRLFLLVKVLSICWAFSGGAYAAPPTSQPYSISGEWRQTGGYNGPITLDWIDSLHGWACDPGGGVVVLSVDAAGGVVIDNGWVGDWSVGFSGFVVGGGNGYFMPLSRDFGMGSQLEPTLLMVVAGLGAGIALLFVVIVFCRMFQPVRVFGQGIADG